MTLEIKNLTVEVEGTQIIRNISLALEPGKILALMGPNGSGKSTLANVLAGHPKYTITQGQIFLDGKEITSLKPDERAKAGLFLSFQYPPSLPGITIGKFLRAAVNAQREAQGEKPHSVVEFHSILKEAVTSLQLNSEFIRRYLNHGFSGGEKKKMEVLQLLLLRPRYIVLDETDSGLDVDAIRIVAEGIRHLQKMTQSGILIITHYSKFLEILPPDTVAVLSKGDIVAVGNYELAQKIEEDGFGSIVKEGEHK
ncbi:Fe-S cluster assembly ATPase SufC [Candidatus Woesearchaeota archaeon]|nr:Fe-S cluster assembly ATPase SufC [Candidatus Woesearchaeota archaeon]